jgi:dephospho-CoA kinase
MQNCPKIIAICGLKRSGKDTIADYLCSTYGYTKVKIANPLKQSLKVMFGFTDEQLESDRKDVIDERWGVEPRKIMQFMGTEVMQYKLQEIMPDIGRRFWIKNLIEEHIKCMSNNSLLVIPDLRFKHEYNMLMSYNTVFWRVDRITDIDNASHPCDIHVSEQEYLDIPVSYIYKNKDRKNLYKQIDEILNNIQTNQT